MTQENDGDFKCTHDKTRRFRLFTSVHSILVHALVFSLSTIIYFINIISPTLLGMVSGLPGTKNREKEKTSS